MRKSDSWSLALMHCLHTVPLAQPGPRCLGASKHGQRGASLASSARIGLPPSRIDLLIQIDGVDFALAWKRRFVTTVVGRSMPFLSCEDLLRNKRASSRPKDLQNVAMLDAMRDAGPLDVERVRAVLIQYLGDECLEPLAALAD